MPYTGLLKNDMLEKAKELVTWIGAYIRETPKPCTSESSTKISLSKHGFKNNEVVLFIALTGGQGLVSGRPYFIREEAENSFALSQTSGGPLESWTTEITEAEIARVKEVSSGTYARVATSWGTVEKGAVEDTTTHELNIPASTTVQYVSGHSASTGGNLLVLEEIAAETYTSAGVLKIIGNRYDLLAVA